MRHRWWLGSRRLWAAVLLPLLAVPAPVDAAGKKPRRTDGPYNVTVGGSCAGRARAVVAGPVLAITAQVTDESSGAEGPLVATDLRIDGSHFRGKGVVFGRAATFAGRLDGYAGDKHFRGARVLCSFTDARGELHGRITGVLR